MKKNSWSMILVLLLVFGVVFVALIGQKVVSFFDRHDEAKLTRQDSILHLKLEGVIINGDKFLKNLKKFRKEKSIKAIVIEINSPGGVVGPSQEIYAEIKRTRDEFKIPVVAFSNGVMASGAYYSAVAADRIVVAPGAMVGSIGVIMEFANLEKLYDWAKVSRYTITTGKYKDSGSEFRSMRDDERQLFQEMINEVWEQFKQAVAEGRNMKPELVEPIADGRVMTGAWAVKNSLADSVGTLNDAFESAGDLAKLEDYEIFEPPKRRPNIFEMLVSEEDEEDPVTKFSQNVVKQVLRPELVNRPLFLMPGSW